ncbi:MAG: GTP 3',8-cyclase MoaA [Demequina sp.]|nr:GTP 3',8-cyclase MoaA [Demequina sp.]
MNRLVDRYGRVHTDLRISLTDRCSLRCTYCMPADGVPWLASSTLLTTDELVRLARIAVSLGVREVRLTGGEPLLRPAIVDVVAELAAITTPDGPLDLSLTTNALRLPSLAAPLRDAGLNRVNISLDTLQRARFIELTRRDRLADTLAGIEAARAVGFAPIKLNALIMRGVNDDEIADLVQFAVDRGLQMRFIEHMPLDAGHTWRREEMVTADEILAAISRRFELTPLGIHGTAPAEEWAIAGADVTVGVIASVTRTFCERCDRVRLTADGQFRNCLFAHEESDLRTLLREGADDDRIAEAMIACVATKRPGHGIDDPAFVQPSRPMSAIGG